MDETKPKEEEGKPEGATAQPEEGVQSETVTELDRADQIAERQKRENDRREKLIDREEGLAARKMVGGTADAGQKPEKKPETDDEFLERLEKGEVDLAE